MQLKFDDIHTFLEVFKAGTFTLASRHLGLTQSALSQKIARIEDTLQATIFIRHPRKLELTSSGERLLIYAKEAIRHQADFLETFNQYQHELSGVIRIAGYSSIMRSLIIPALSDFLRKNKKVRIEFSSHETFELPDVLKTNKADFIITDFFPSLPRVNEQEITKEEYVIITAKKFKDVSNVFLDHGPFDNATESYFKHTQQLLDYERAYMGDVYSIIDGVALGLGKAVMSEHLVKDDRRFQVHRKRKRYYRPVVLSYFEQNYYGPLHEQVLSILEQSFN